MDNSFADLIPKKSEISENSFMDLIPEETGTQVENTFADLIPDNKKVKEKNSFSDLIPETSIDKFNIAKQKYEQAKQKHEVALASMEELKANPPTAMSALGLGELEKKINYWTSPVPKEEIQAEWKNQPISANDSTLEAAGKGVATYFKAGVPLHSALGVARGTVEFPVEALKAQMTNDVQKQAEIVKGLADFIARPTGLKDWAKALVEEGKLWPDKFTEMGEAWDTDPFGSTMAILPFIKGGFKTAIDTAKGVKKGYTGTLPPPPPPPPSVPSFQVEKVASKEHVAGKVPMEDLPESFKASNSFADLIPETPEKYTGVERRESSARESFLKLTPEEQAVSDSLPEGFTIKKVPTGAVNPYGTEKLFRTTSLELVMPDGTTAGGSLGSLADIAKEFSEKVFKDKPTTTPHEISVKLGKPNQISVLESMGIKDVVEQKKAIVQDVMRNPGNKVEAVNFLKSLNDKVINAELQKIQQEKPIDISSKQSESQQNIYTSNQGGFVKIPQTLVDLSDKTREVLSKAKYGYSIPEGKGTQAGLDALRKFHKAQRDVEFTAGELTGIGKKLNLSPEKQMELSFALQDPQKAGKLAPQDVSIYNFLKNERDKVSQYGLDTGVLTKEQAKKNYLYQWWIDEKTGEPHKAMFSKYSPNAPQLKKRTISSYEEGIAKGKTPVTLNPFELISKSLVSITRAATSRELFKGLKNIEADMGGEWPNKVFSVEEGTLRSSISTEVKPFRLVESWRNLVKQGQTDGYIKYSHWALDKPIVWKDGKGNLHILKGDVGVVKDLYPYVRGYIESPTYGNFSKLNFASKSLKLMSGFHIQSLTMQALVGSTGLGRVPIYNVMKGLKQIKENAPELRGLYRNGLELKGYTDIGPQYSNLLETMGKHKGLKTVSKLMTATQKLTFDVVHPGIKTNTAITIFRDLVKKEEVKKGRPLTEVEKEPLYKDTVHYVDRLYSGEDYKTALLNTNQWMAKYFYSPEARKRWQTALISPQWQKAHIGIASDISKSIFTKEGRAAPISKYYRKYLYGAVGLYGVANLYNFVMTKYMDGEGKLMVQNDGHNSFSIRAPYDNPDGAKVYFRPLKSIFEIPELMSDLVGKSISKLAPWAPAIAGQINPDSYKKYRGFGDVPKRIGDLTMGLFAPMAEPTIMSQSKALPSKVLSVLGFSTSKGYSEPRTESKAEEKAKEYMITNMPAGTKTHEEIQKSNFKRKLYSSLRKNQQEGLADLGDAINEGKITPKEALTIFKEKDQPYLVRLFTNLKIDQAIDVYKTADEKEKELLKPLLIKHTINKIKSDITSEERKNIMDKVMSVLQEKQNTKKSLN